MADDSDQLRQDDIEALLQQAKQGGGGAAPEPKPPAEETGETLGQDEIEALLRGGGPPAGDSPPVAKAETPASTPPPAASAPEPQGEDATKVLKQEDIEALLQQGPPKKAEAPPKPKSRPAPSPRRNDPPGDHFDMAQDDIEFLLNQAEAALASIDADDRDVPPGTQPYRFEDFAGAPANSDSATLDLIRDVELDLKIELGRTHMHLEEVLRLRKGSVVPLDKLAGDPVDIYVNGRLIARGEVLVLNDNFCVRVAELIAAEAARAG